jgi:hypothetical protein
VNKIHDPRENHLLTTKEGGATDGSSIHLTEVSSVATAPNRLLSKTRFCEPCTRGKNLEIFDKINKTKS